MEHNLHVLTRFADSSSFLYVEHAWIERKDQSVEIRREGETIDVPAASVSTLILGPGTRITHAAVVTLAECGTGIVWAGDELQRFYAAGGGKTRSSINLLKQAAAWADIRSRMEVIARMYRFRFPEELPPHLSLAQIRGREGVRVREAYARASRDWNVAWSGRNYDRGDWNAADPINRALSAGATVLYGICHSAITAAGFSPGIGFIHTGKALSFVYDLADIYKIELLVPTAFEVASHHAAHPEGPVRKALRQRCHESGLMDRIMRDLDRLFHGLAAPDALEGEENVDLEDRPGYLWGPDGPVAGGVNHGGDDD